jgi:hypothetical protein
MQNHHPVFKSQLSLLAISLFLPSSSLFGPQPAAIPVSNPNQVAHSSLVSRQHDG